MSTPAYRYLKGYTLDPGFSTQLDTMGINETVYRIQYEPVLLGPVGEYLEVIDYDPASNCYYQPVDLNAEEVLLQHGLPPSEGNPKFHQQFVYTVVMKTIEHFERSLGRKIVWRRPWIAEEMEEKYVQHLRIYPHAMREANAFYSPEKVALLFGYFEAGSRIQGSNFPGGVIFTCLSPDIVAHETTHAILDSIHPRFLENTNPDVPAFHEGFADIVALLQRFTITSLVEHQLERTRGRLDEFSLLGELATQFGQGLDSGRGALRGAIGKIDRKTGKWKRFIPDPNAYQKVFEAHHRGAILVAVVFDAFQRLYHHRTQDLIRIATQGTGVLPQGAIHPDLVKRLSREASHIATHILQICIRALDYCPPFDITFGSYLRALITADIDIAPADENGYRIALIEAFRAWGIFPERVNTLSAESLCWSPPELAGKEKDAMEMIAGFLKKEVQCLLDFKDRKQIIDQSRIIQARLNNLLMKMGKTNETESLWKKYAMTEEVWKRFLKKLGIVIDPITLKYDGEEIPFGVDAIPLEVHNVRPAYRYGREERQVEQVVVTLTQTLRVKKGEYKGLKFRGGCTIILSISNNNLNADYIIVKNIASELRLKTQLDYQLKKVSSSLPMSEAIDEPDDAFHRISFEKLHFH